MGKRLIAGDEDGAGIPFGVGGRRNREERQAEGRWQVGDGDGRGSREGEIGTGGAHGEERDCARDRSESWRGAGKGRAGDGEKERGLLVANGEEAVRGSEDGGSGNGGGSLEWKLEGGWRQRPEADAAVAWGWRRQEGDRWQGAVVAAVTAVVARWRVAAVVMTAAAASTAMSS